MPYLPPTSPLTPLTTHAHSALLLSALLHHLPSLSAAPARTLTHTLPHLLLAQTVYSVLLLSNPPRYTHTRPRRTPSLATALLPTALCVALTLTAGTAGVWGLLVLFGAAASTHVAETAAAAAHVALLVVLPMVCVYGVDGAAWRGVVGGAGTLDEAVGGAVGAGVGAWLGAVPIPLDWDREWQKWPVTVVVGAYVGYVVGKTLGGLFKGRKLA